MTGGARRSHQPTSPLRDPSAYARAYFEATLEHAIRRAPDADLETALDALFAFDAAFFLGYWLSPSVHRRLLHRFGQALPGLAGIDPPAAGDQRIVLAQHVRELEAELGATEWTARLRALTESAVPAVAEDWDQAVRQAAGVLAATGNHRPLAVAHAQRRLWALAHPSEPRPVNSSLPIAAFRSLVREAVHGDARTVQVVEIAADELLTAPYLAADLFAAILPRRDDMRDA